MSLPLDPGACLLFGCRYSLPYLPTYINLPYPTVSGSPRENSAAGRHPLFLRADWHQHLIGTGCCSEQGHPTIRPVLSYLLPAGIQTVLDSNAAILHTRHLTLPIHFLSYKTSFYRGGSGPLCTPPSDSHSPSYFLHKLPTEPLAIYLTFHRMYLLGSARLLTDMGRALADYYYPSMIQGKVILRL